MTVPTNYIANPGWNENIRDMFRTSYPWEKVGRFIQNEPWPERLGNYAKDSVNDIAYRVEDGFERTLDGASHTIGNATNGLTNTIGESTNWFLKGLGDNWHDTSHKFQLFATNLMDNPGETLGNVWNGTKQSVPKILDGGLADTKNIIGGAKHYSQEIGQAFNQPAYHPPVDTIVNNGTQLVDSGKEMVEKAGSVVANNADNWLASLGSQLAHLPAGQMAVGAGVAGAAVGLGWALGKTPAWAAKHPQEWKTAEKLIASTAKTV